MISTDSVTVAISADTELICSGTLSLSMLCDPVVFPQDLIEKGLAANNFAMLGLGDIVIPGIFIALLLRFDVRWALHLLCLRLLLPLCAIYSVGKKQQDSLLVLITSRNIYRCSKFFHCQTQHKICYEMIIT